MLTVELAVLICVIWKRNLERLNALIVEADSLVDICCVYLQQCPTVSCAALRRRCRVR
jgi:hypothetical protein